jgi:hypothetical protein
MIEFFHRQNFKEVIGGLRKLRFQSEHDNSPQLILVG